MLTLFRWHVDAAFTVAQKYDTIQYIKVHSKADEMASLI